MIMEKIVNIQRSYIYYFK